MGLAFLLVVVMRLCFTAYHDYHGYTIPHSYRFNESTAELRKLEQITMREHAGTCFDMLETPYCMLCESVCAHFISVHAETARSSQTT